MEGFEHFYPDAETDVAQIVEDSVFEAQLLAEPGLTEPERSVLIASFDGESQRKTADRIGKDRETVSRTLRRLRGKLTHYWTA
jgi:RNA polymerase sigma factor (sigma-70 family)